MQTLTIHCFHLADCQLYCNMFTYLTCPLSSHKLCLYITAVPDTTFTIQTITNIRLLLVAEYEYKYWNEQLTLYCCCRK